MMFINSYFFSFSCVCGEWWWAHSTSMDKPLMVSWTAWHWMSCQEVCGIRLVWFDHWMPLTTYQVVERATMEIMWLDLFGFWICLWQSVIGNYQDVGRATMRFGNKFLHEPPTVGSCELARHWRNQQKDNEASFVWHKTCNWQLAVLN